jgi:hypothetical protein
MNSLELLILAANQLDRENDIRNADDLTPILHRVAQRLAQVQSVKEPKPFKNPNTYNPYLDIVNSLANPNGGVANPNGGVAKSPMSKQDHYLGYGISALQRTNFDLERSSTALKHYMKSKGEDEATIDKIDKMFYSYYANQNAFQSGKAGRVTKPIR